MASNYSQYAKEIQAAAKRMHPDKRRGRLKVTFCIVISIIVSIILFTGVNAHITNAQISQALQEVSTSIENTPIEVKVNDADENLSTLLSDRENGLSVSEEAKISEQIKTSLTPELIKTAKGIKNSDGLLEAHIVLEDGTPVIITIKHNEKDNTYSILSIVAELNKEKVEKRKKEANSPISTQEQKDKYASASTIKDWNEDDFIEMTGIEDLNQEDNEAVTAAVKPIKVLAEDLVMVVPSKYKEQNIEQPDDDAHKSAKEDKDKTDEELNANSIKIYNRSYKNDTGSSILVRAENLGSAFANMNGKSAAEKTMEYWIDTNKTVAEGAGQTLKDETVGYQTELFYDVASEMWGYWGRVELTDGTRDIVYNRVVFIDELADQMITVSYRHDSAAGAGGDRPLQEFKEMFMHAPSEIISEKSDSNDNVDIADDKNGTGNDADSKGKQTDRNDGDNSGDDSVSVDAEKVNANGSSSEPQISNLTKTIRLRYQHKLDEILVLSGDEMTVKEKQKAAEQEEKQVDAADSQ